LDFINSEKLSYGYKLDNFEWKLSEQPEVYFTNVAYGAHQLKLKVIGTSDAENNNSAQIKSLNFKIVPPWYRSWPAYIIYGLILILGIFLITLLVLKKKIAIAQMENIATLDKLKSEMYANISHEIRTPVTVINGLSELLLKESDDLENNTNVKGILKSSNQLLNLVNEMLELVSLDANKVEVNYKNGDVVEFITQCIELYQPLANSNGQTLMINTSIPELQMDIDDNKLQKILNNLLSNALKFTPENGTVTVHVSKDKANLKIEVSDTGKGIKNEELPLVFDRYYKTFDQNDNLGSGIGMAITKELVELLNGRIAVESQVNKGTRFTIHLPITNSVEQTNEFIYEAPFVNETPLIEKAVDNIQNSEPSKPSLLVVEDSVEIRVYLERLLGTIYNITTAKNGSLALDIIKNQDFDLIISDLQMPEMDGFTFCEKLKNDIDSSHIPFIVLTARAEPQDKVKGYEMGIDAYITKPFNAEELLVIVKNLIAKRLDQITYFNKLLSLKDASSESLNINKIDVDLIKKLQEIILDKTQKTSIEVLTKTLLVSKSQLHRKVKALTGVSVTQYVNHIKIQKAKELLLNTELNINEIAYEVGYDDPTYFSRVFKKVMEVSPDQFRKEKDV
jgi:signal transduction histidine kinase/DNA-binding response OmpR family regulator